MATFPTKFRLCTMALTLCLGLGGMAQAEAITIAVPADKTHRLISVVVTKGLTSTKKLPTPALRDARKRMMANKPVTPDELRGLADHGDGLAAERYEHLLTATNSTASASDIAYYGTIALGTGRVWPLPAVIDALHKIDPATEPPARKKAYAAVLYPYAWAGNSVALDGIIDLTGKDKLFGEMTKATQDHIALLGEKNKDGRASLRLALILLQKPDRSAADVTLAQHFLKLAQASDDPQIQATANTLASLLASDGTLMTVKQ